MVTLTNALGFAFGAILGLVLPALRRVLFARKQNLEAVWYKRLRGPMYLAAKERPEPEPIDSAWLVRAFTGCVHACRHAKCAEARLRNRGTR